MAVQKKKAPKKIAKIQTKSESLQTKPNIEPDLYSLTMSSKELISLMQILSFAKQVFEQMAVNLDKEGQLEEAKTYIARSHISEVLFNKFQMLADIGEPTSRDVH